MKIVDIAIILVILVSFGIGIYLYPSMPEQMASHWGAAGQVNGYMDRFWAIFLMPIISVLLLGMFILIPKIDPLKENIKKFRRYFDGFVLLIILFLFVIYMMTLLWNLGFAFDLFLVMVPCLALLFYYCGILLENAKRNWFIGIRTPWTISSEKVWNKTHKRGGKLFKAFALVSLLGLLFPLYALWFVLVPVISVTIYLIAYSYFEYQKER
jgi:uncharacterized membrane protein